jgi:N-formylglutamate amidohydrolase
MEPATAATGEPATAAATAMTSAAAAATAAAHTYDVIVKRRYARGAERL